MNASASASAAGAVATPAEVEEIVTAERTRTITLRLRVLAWVTLIVASSFVMLRPTASPGVAARYMLLRMLGIMLVAAFLAGTYRPGFVHRQNLWGMLLAAGIASLSAVGGSLRRDLGIIVSLHITMMLMTSAVLPWGLRCQTMVVAVCAATLVGGVIAVGFPAPGSAGIPTLINAGAGALLSLFVAYQTRSAYDQAARENVQLRAAEARNRGLAAELEEKVRARTAELEGALADQREITRAISHDLRQPLRHIHGFMRIFEDAESAEADAETRRVHLERVRVATLRMDRMVDALLELSRVSGRPLQRERVDLSRCADDIFRELERAEPGRRVECRIHPGLVEHCDEGLTRTLLLQLLANAWKFTREREVGVIEFGRRAGAYYVADNGPGFDMQHTRRLFQAFERLHHFDEFEGEGVGLAIADRIVRRHGGRIWAEAEPGAGATFLFTLTS